MSNNSSLSASGLMRQLVLVPTTISETSFPLLKRLPLMLRLCFVAGMALDDIIVVRHLRHHCVIAPGLSLSRVPNGSVPGSGRVINNDEGEKYINPGPSIITRPRPNPVPRLPFNNNRTSPPPNETTQSHNLYHNVHLERTFPAQRPDQLGRRIRRTDRRQGHRGRCESSPVVHLLVVLLPH